MTWIAWWTAGIAATVGAFLATYAGDWPVALGLGLLALVCVVVVGTRK